MCRVHTHHNNIPDVKLAEWISVAVARICFASKNHINSVRASQTPNMYDFYAENIQRPAQNWIRPHFPGWVVTESTPQFDPVARRTDDFSGFWWQQCRWCHVSSTWPLDQMCRDQETQEPIWRGREQKLIHFFYIVHMILYKYLEIYTFYDRDNTRAIYKRPVGVDWIDAVFKMRLLKCEESGSNEMRILCCPKFIHLHI